MNTQREENVMTDLDLRRRTAEAIGWTGLHMAKLLNDDSDLVGLPPGSSPHRTVCKRVPYYETSLDALYRDVVPVLNEQGWYLVLSQGISFDAEWTDKADYIGSTAFDKDNPAIAICTAFLALVKAAKGE